MKNKKGDVAVIVIIIVIVAITAGIVGWMFAKKSQEPVQQAVVTQPTAPVAKTQPETIVQSQPVASIMVPANWKTYTSKMYDALISLPNNWKLVGVGDGTLYDTNEELFNDGLTTVSSLDKKDVMTFTNGPLDLASGTIEERALNSKCTSNLIEINNQKIKETTCPDATANSIPGRYNYEFVDKKLVVVIDNKTAATDKVISLIKFN